LSRRLDPLAWFRSRRPPHAFVLSRSRLAYVGRQDPREGAKGEGTEAWRFLSRPLPADAFAEGPAGSPVAGGPLAETVSRLTTDAGGRVPAASLVVPDDFVRVLAVDVENPDRNPKEVDDVLAWKFGKSFGEPPPPLRVSWQVAGSGSAGIRVLGVVVPEEAAASWERAFEKSGVRIGAVETATLAASRLGLGALAEGNGLVLWAQGAMATVAYFEAGVLRFLRTRSTPDSLTALQEVRLTASYVAPRSPREGGEAGSDLEAAAADVTLPCIAGPPGEPAVQAFQAFRNEQGGPPPLPLTLSALRPRARLTAAADDPAVVEALGVLSGED